MLGGELPRPLRRRYNCVLRCRKAVLVRGDSLLGSVRGRYVGRERRSEPSSESRNSHYVGLTGHSAK